jgi:polyvinyl alcohol dehydrogenase (cytochrome)
LRTVVAPIQIITTPGFHLLALALLIALSTAIAAGQAPDAKDWSMYNYDVVGSRYNRGETAIKPSNAARLEEKWRFPPRDAAFEIGVIHATPIVVASEVYFGTATDSAFYKLRADGALGWKYRNPRYGSFDTEPSDETQRSARFQSAANGVMGSALVSGDMVYFGDLGGWFYALDRINGQERWKLNSRSKKFPGSHPINVFFASPILVQGKLIVAGGTLEQVVSALPFYHGNNGRGFVMALDPINGDIFWKYDVGPQPEPLDPPITIQDAWGDHVFYFGPATSSVWSTPSFDAASGTIFFGTDVNTAPRRSTPENPRLDTRESCAVIALDVHDGGEKWVTQLNAADIWTNAMRSYDPATGRYKDQSIGDTPKVYRIEVDGQLATVVGVGCKNGGFYVLRADDGRIVHQTPIYTGPPAYPLSPEPDPRMLALPSCIGGLQTGCATDGHAIFTNGIDALLLGSQATRAASMSPPTAGRVVALSLDTRRELWRHERPKVPSVGGPPPKRVYRDVGDPVASGIALANGVVYFTTVTSGKLVALDASSGELLKEVEIGPVWSGPSVSRGRVYVGTGNTLFTPLDAESYFPKKRTGVLFSFGLPGENEVQQLGKSRAR